MEAPHLDHKVIPEVINSINTNMSVRAIRQIGHHTLLHSGRSDKCLDGQSHTSHAILGWMQSDIYISLSVMFLNIASALLDWSARVFKVCTRYHEWDSNSQPWSCETYEVISVLSLYHRKLCQHFTLTVTNCPFSVPINCFRRISLVIGILLAIDSVCTVVSAYN